MGFSDILRVLRIVFQNSLGCLFDQLEYLLQVVRRWNAPERPVDLKNGKFPYCLVWVPLPIIAWLVPFVGHVGICREDGVILDFAGNINVDNLAFGSCAKYVRLSPNNVRA